MTKILSSVTVALVLGTTVTFAQIKTAEDAKMEAKYQKEKTDGKVALALANKKLEDDFAKHDKFAQVIADDYKAISEAHYKIGDLDSSTRYALQALKVEMKLLNENDPALAKLYFDTGNKYYMHKQHPTAMLYMKKAVKIYLNSSDKESLALADTYEAISSIYINLEDLSKSLVYCEKCLKIRKKKLGKDNESVKRTVQNIEFLKQEIEKK